LACLPAGYRREDFDAEDHCRLDRNARKHDLASESNNVAKGAILWCAVRSHDLNWLLDEGRMTTEIRQIGRSSI
jgi:hypothetical protein